MTSPIFNAACTAWRKSATFRSKRDRYKRFTYGDQWSDPVTTDGHRIMTTGDHARQRGRRPMTNNLLRRLVKSVIGRYRYSRHDLPPLSGEAGRLYGLNNLDELDCRALEEFLISGCTIQRVIRERTLRGTDTWVTIVSPDSFFVNDITDPRGWDCELVGMLHDWSLTETVLRLAGPDAHRARLIRDTYSRLMTDDATIELDRDRRTVSFHTAAAGRCRVIEVWTLEAAGRLKCHDTDRATMFTLPDTARDRLDRLNASRAERGRPAVEYCWEAFTRWRCRWFAPDGTELHTHLSDAPGGSHPFHFRFYPMIDGEVHSLVEDVIDQQIYINELISLIDHVVSCAAKGVLLFPTGEKIPGATWKQIATLWSNPDAIIPIRGRTGQLPVQVSNSGSNLGARELLETQMKMFEDVSGVTNALMGRTQSGNIGAEHYESQVKNAIIAIADILDTFTNFINTRNGTLSHPAKL